MKEFSNVGRVNGVPVEIMEREKKPVDIITYIWYKIKNHILLLLRERLISLKMDTSKVDSIDSEKSDLDF